MKPEDESKLWRWALRGIGGALRLLDSFLEDGIRPEDRDRESLLFLKDRIDGIVAESRGLPRPSINHSPEWPAQSEKEKRHG